ncbi:MAG: lipopolysaccharide transport periplasmic protein LptA [Proteobacteria bacterium]|nr:lipopolysaccharide transport periplasmic protein LptA [Pseudomonadota bacterium]
MAASLLRRCAPLLACAWASLAAPQIPGADTRLPVQLDAQSSDLDYRNNVIVFRKVKITQGKLSVEADQATANGVNFDNSHWQFRGKVRINVEHGFLNADDADITFGNKLLTKAVVNGAPAEFEQRRDQTGQLARGRADTIVYDVKAGTVVLSHNAWLSDGPNEIRGETLKYSVTEQRVVANAAEQGSQRVRITITPPAQKPKP